MEHYSLPKTSYLSFHPILSISPKMTFLVSTLGFHPLHQCGGLIKLVYLRQKLH